MKSPVGFFPCLNVTGAVAGPVGFLRLIENGFGQMRSGIAQRQGFERSPHLDHFPDVFETETGNANASARLADDKTLRLQTPERLANRHMAHAKFLGNMILTKPGTRLKLAGNDTLGKHLADPDGNGLVFGGLHVL